MRGVGALFRSGDERERVGRPLTARDGVNGCYQQRPERTCSEAWGRARHSEEEKGLGGREGTRRARDVRRGLDSSRCTPRDVAATAGPWSPRSPCPVPAVERRSCARQSLGRFSMTAVECGHLSRKAAGLGPLALQPLLPTSSIQAGSSSTWWQGAVAALRRPHAHIRACC